ncbi:Aste57867_1494 [Aphanomyces stellatus]|uniref:Aste57867_1494 protein n=1 Tax=Aphanomyces stellatus TaxID=120398 RepID=A0A485KAS3_9STRA|nr:hypothetical protein As57867_001493 [Aphanomyces stellatus]VFT78710.1 Aste57867_1494 [Aphanomyces stellatus]
MMPVIESVILTLPRHLDLRNLEAILTHISEDSRVREAKQRMLRRAVSLFRMDVLEWLMQQDMGDSQDVLWRFAYPTQWPESKFLTDLARPHPHDHAMIAFFAQHDVPLTRMLTMAAMARVGLRPLVYLALGDKANMLRWWKSPTSVLWLEHLVTKIGGVVAIMPHLVTYLSTKKCDITFFPRVYDAWVATVNDLDEKHRVQETLLARQYKKRIKLKVARSMTQDTALFVHVARVSSIDVVKQVLANVATKMPVEEALEAEANALNQAIAADNVFVVQWLVHRQVAQGGSLQLERNTLA